MIEKINHIGIAVADLESQIAFYRDTLGLKFKGTEDVPEQKVKVAMFEVGQVRIELLAPTSEESPIAKFLSKRGPGMHHIAYEVDDIHQQIHLLQENAVKMIDKSPKQGADGTQIAFVHPKSTGGVLMELCSHAKDQVK